MKLRVKVAIVMNGKEASILKDLAQRAYDKTDEEKKLLEELDEMNRNAMEVSSRS